MSQVQLRDEPFSSRVGLVRWELVPFNSPIEREREWSRPAARRATGDSIASRSGKEMMSDARRSGSTLQPATWRPPGGIPVQTPRWRVASQ